ncbi:protein phosphatase 1 regulatory subunit 3B-A-like [Amphiura filiformis]|uniref:protein phosphatase 1 regulatory subunit 3B-A-like n=1 Tax=Amphiura filiformis TaxID=82378 RepID=UPI003B216C08
MAVLLDRDLIMPIDTLFSLSSSPPISYLTAAAYRYHRGTIGATYESNRAVPSYPGPGVGFGNLHLNDVNSLSNGMFTNSIKPYNSSKFSVRAAPKMLEERGPLRSCLRVKIVQNGDDGSLDSLESPTDPSSPTSDIKEDMDRLSMINGVTSLENSPKEEKKVVFADTKGLPLENIKFLDGPTDLPPSLSEDLLKHIIQDAKPEPDHPFTYIADFEQPASNYMEFRERVEHKCVSLENVMITDNIKVIGTVKVKNVAFEKMVMVRVTFDEWETCEDVLATFVAQSNVSASRYDTFSFEFEIPPNQGGKQFEFCINYVAANGDFWDNNDGNNYRIVSKESRRMSQQQKMASYYSSISGQHNWGEFSFWKTAEDETPYW